MGEQVSLPENTSDHFAPPKSQALDSLCMDQAHHRQESCRTSKSSEDGDTHEGLTQNASVH